LKTAQQNQYHQFCYRLRSPPEIFDYLLPFFALCGYVLSSKKAPKVVANKGLSRQLTCHLPKPKIKISNPYPDNSKTTAYTVIFFNDHLIVTQNKTCCISASPPSIQESASVLFSCCINESLLKLSTHLVRKCNHFRTLVHMKGVV